MMNRRIVLGAEIPVQRRRARVGKWIVIVLVLEWPAVIINPRLINTGDPHHGPRAWVELLLESMPYWAQTLAMIAIELYFVFEFVTLYNPASKIETLAVLKGDEVVGFDMLGRIVSLKRSAISFAFAALGSMFVRSAGRWIRVPLSILTLASSEKQSVRTLLKAAVH